MAAWSSTIDRNTPRLSRRRVSLENNVSTALSQERVIAALLQDAVAAQAEIAKLRFQLARYRRAEFGRSWEKLAHEIEQLELAIETLETDQAERLAAASPVVAAAIQTATEARKPARRPLPDHLPREEVAHPAPRTCPSCGGALRRIGEDSHRDARLCARSVQGDPTPPREALLPRLRHDSCLAGTRACDCPRSRRGRTARLYRHVEV
jgi:Transposase C of IS166 homeodomain